MTSGQISVHVFVSRKVVVFIIPKMEYFGWKSPAEDVDI